MSFEMTTLGEFATVQGGYAYKSQDFISKGDWPVLKIKNVRNGYVSYDDTSFVSTEIAAATSRWASNPGDILISMTGSGPSAPDSLVGRVARVWKGEKSALINQRVGRLILKDEAKLDPDYLFYLLSLKENQDYLVSNSTGSANQVNISAKTIESVPCPKIDHSTSSSIASILLALDKRIRLLRDTNATLEAIAQALFKSWFVDFDPVRDKQEGREPEGMDADTAALFPDSFEESELGLVPRGWQVGKVDTVLTRLPAKVRYTKDHITTDGVTPIYEQGAGILLGYHEGKAQYQADENDPAFIFGDHTCVTHLSCEPFDISQNVIPLKGKDRATLWVYYAAKDKQTFQEYRRHWMELIVKDIVIPTAQICDAFAKNANSYHLKMESNVRQSRTLATLRDTLLPRLISGQLRLPNAEDILEVATA